MTWVRLRDSLSNPGRPLLALVKGLEEAGELAKLQVNAGAVAALIAQTGVEDPTLVRLAVKENRKLSAGEVAVLAEAYKAGESQKELARRFGVHEQTVRAHLQRSGVALRPVRVLTDEQEDEIARLYVEEWLSLAKLAVKFSVSATAVRSALIRRGVARRAQASRELNK